jgi:tetratricopeptide (TPR) repeat protein
MSSISVLQQKIEGAIERRDYPSMAEALMEIESVAKRKERAELILAVNTRLEEAGFLRDEPELFSSLMELSREEIESLVRRMVDQYISTANQQWIGAIISLSGRLDRKSHQSKVLSSVTRTLVQEGVRARNPVLIEEGMGLLAHISFRKYRSALLIEIVPSLIAWGIETRDIRFHQTALDLVQEIGDVSERADLHCEIVTAMVAIGVAQRDLPIIIDAIRSASTILQKIRRINCTLGIIDITWRSPLGRNIADIRSFVGSFADLPLNRQTEILECLIQELLERVRDKSQLYSTLISLEREIPGSRRYLVIRLLKKAELTADLWYIRKALEFNGRIVDPAQVPLKEIIHSGIVIAEKTGDAQFLMAIIDLVDKLYDRSTGLHTYLHFTNTLLRIGEFYSAIAVFGRVFPIDYPYRPQIDDSVVRLLKEGVIRDEVDLLSGKVLTKMEPSHAEIAIYRAVYELCKDHPFGVLTEHSAAIKALANLHPRSDHLVCDCIRILIEHGFLTSQDPGILIDFAEGITDLTLRERAVSTIIKNLTSIGVEQSSRDFLQRAIGLSINIEGQHTRSEALFNVIEAASLLAVKQSDLDLLRRMKVWSTSLLDKEYAVSAIGKIIQGMIRYALIEKAPYALDEATQILETIDDPSLRQVLMERIIENYIRVGCLTLEETGAISDSSDFVQEIRPFRQALSLLKQYQQKQQISLKIASSIDIILQYADRSTNMNFFVPLTIFSLEIENLYERDAMITRIASGLREIIELLDSTDSYEILSYLLMRLDQAGSSELILDLAYNLNEQIRDVYTRLSGMCTLADLYLQNGKTGRAGEILTNVRSLTEAISSAYQRVLLLAEVATLLVRSDEKQAYACLGEAIELLPLVEPDKDSLVRVQLVLSIVSLNSTNQNPENITRAMQIVSEIRTPEHYIEALIAISNMVRHDPVKCRDILRAVAASIQTIVSPYERAIALLDVVPIAESSGEYTYADLFLGRAEAALQEINIPFIVSVVKKAVVQKLLMISARRPDPAYRERAVAVARSIEDDDIRTEVLRKMNLEFESPPRDLISTNVLEARRKILSGEFTKGMIVSLERVLHTLSDRALQARLYTDLYVSAREAGQENMAEKMLQAAITAAGIIRPLSRRVYVLGEIALRTFAAGDEARSGDVMDMAGEAATNIREFKQRDQVFDELAMVIRVMQELRL